MNELLFPMVLLLIALGVLAGGLTTITGMGGGLTLLLCLSAIFDPMTALVLTAPALLVGNLHRVALFRRFLDVHIARRLMLGAVPGAFIGGLIAGTVPRWLLDAALLTVTGVAIVRMLGWWDWRPAIRWLTPAAGGVGVLAASSGGGVLMAPVLRSAGVTGNAFLATSSLVAASMHIARLSAYGAAGQVSTQNLLASALLAGAIAAGNGCGRAIRARMTLGLINGVEVGTMIVCVGLSLFGLAR